ncbi:MAG: hypothetical protein HZB47_10575 [Nitrosomonadales bacterium]|nr:hypothetical protein [Nitrosomonadales bacterium]
MDEAAFRRKLSEAIERPCTFEKAVLGNCVSCACSQRIQIAERELVTCQNPVSLSRCTELHELLRHGFAFALGKIHGDSVLSHSQEMRVQCGGLAGLQQVMNDTPQVDNVDALLVDALQKWGELADIPYSEVVHAAASCYKGRHG